MVFFIYTLFYTVFYLVRIRVKMPNTNIMRMKESDKIAVRDLH